MEQIFISLSRDQLKELFEAAIKNTIGTSLPKGDSKVKQYYSRRDLCDQLGISLPTLDNLVKSGKVKSYRIGSRILFKVAEIDSFLESQRYI